jgi:FdhE protein
MRRRRFGNPAAFDAIRPDPDKVGGVAEAPFVRLPDPATLFAARAQRLQDVAPGHPLDAYLRFLSGIVATQHAAHGALPPARLSRPRADGVPPLTRSLLRDDPDFAATLDWFLAHVPVADAPPEAREACDRMGHWDPAARVALAEDVFDMALDPGRLGEALYAGAAVQLYLSRMAASLEAHALKPQAGNTCPCCSGAPVASLIVGWSQASKTRYLCCSLCSTLWNYIRIKCAACGSTAGISYYTIDGGDQAVAVESCTACRTYLKHLQQHDNPLLEPFADDVASFGLDLLVRDEAFQKSGINPLFIGG